MRLKKEEHRIVESNEFDLNLVYTNERTEKPKRNTPMPVRIYLHRKAIREGFDSIESALQSWGTIEFEEGTLYFVEGFKKHFLNKEQAAYVNRTLMSE